MFHIFQKPTHQRIKKDTYALDAESLNFNSKKAMFYGIE